MEESVVETLEVKSSSWDLPNPFDCYSLSRDRELEYGPEPKTLAELRMYELSWALRSKPDRQRKASDPEILSKRRREALEQQESGDLDLDEKLTEKMVNYVLAELAGYAKIADNERGIERGCFDAIWYSDRVISNDVAQRLRTAVSALENVPEAEKDWHPGSNGQVLYIVHPSLYCVVYGRTHAYLPGEPRLDDWTISQKFSWMPSDFVVLADGSIKLVSPYINNLHPEKHQPLYRIIEDVLSGFIPMFERVLGEIEKTNKVALKHSGRIGDADGVECIWSDLEWCSPSPQEGLDETEQEKYYDSKKILLEANIYAGELESVLSPISLRGMTVQCIIKLANIQLTPEQPDYPGGSWHIEGMANEHIVASGIYYYDEEKITESKLSFRVPSGQPIYHKQDDNECMRILYGMESRDDCVQEIGSMVTKPGRALSWPNLFQHCVSSFKLSDPSKPGYRKILAIFLVDPTVDRIVSATDVPPQRAEWAADAVRQAQKDPNSLISRLPRELVDLITGGFPTTAMTTQEAEAYRLALMEELTVFVQAHSDTAYAVPFNMCEH
ncbi:hypothetical protein B0H19DRAFT_1292351 [Mycena capillaripes]|nr:hypothetical protein B0H19DRAFT_1292351 [Mycena capillaripes]